jgi:hypothetical protein
MGRIFWQCLLLALAASAAGQVRAGQFLLAARTNGAWTLEEAETIQVNGKDKVRGIVLSPAPPATWDAKAIGRLADESLAGFSAVMRAPDGTLLAQTGESGGWLLLLPDGEKNKAAQSATDLWRNAVITVKQDHKDKTGRTIRFADLYAIIPGQDPSLSAARLATDVSLHRLPGVDDPRAFRQMLELMPVAAKTYSSGPAADKIRDYVRSAMSIRLAKWNEGDAPIDVLDECLALAKVSEAAYPGDAAQAGLRKQAAETRKWLDRKVAILRALDAGKQADAFLTAYREFEPYDKSFSDLAGKHRAHLQESALSHLDTARQLRKQGDYANAIRHLRLAQLRNPELAEAGQLLEEVRLEIARLSAQKFTDARRGIDPRSPAQVQLQRKLLLAEQYLNDGKEQEAEQALHEAEAIDKDEPKITLGQARLALARGDLGMALALLDLYAGMAVTPQDFAEGEKLRASVQYKIENTRTDVQAQLKTLYNDQRFASALQASANGLKLDNEEPAFLFQAGVNASLLRHGDDAVPLLRRYLDLSNSTRANREQRLTTLRLLHELSSSSTEAAKTAGNRGMASWFSGAALERGVFYDPVSLAFQPKVLRVNASNHLTVNYEWNGSQLRSVHTKYEEKKTGSNIAKLAIAGAAASQGMSLPVSLRTTGRETNDFYFSYYDDAPQIFKVSRDNVVVKSRKIPVMLPAFPTLGPFGGIGAIGSLVNLGRLGMMSGGLKGLTGLGGLGRGMPNMTGFGNLASVPGLSNASLKGLPATGGMTGLPSMGQFLPGRNYSVHADPDGGSTSGYLTLWNSPRLDTRLAYMVTGKRVAVGFSGNRYFHPFIWDAIHFFELDYDDQGRVSHAWELDEPNAPRLDFTWEGQKLMSVVGHGHAEEIVYSRTLSYSGERLVSESITQGGKTSKIQYKYNKQGVLTEAECDTDLSLDGRSRKVEFLDETADRGKRR